MRHTIIIVDDDEAQLWNYQNVLSSEFTVKFATNRQQAIAIMTEYQGKFDQVRSISDKYVLPALVVLDQKLDDYNPIEDQSDVGPGFEGLALIDYIKTEICPLTQVIVITAYHSTNETRGFEAANFGADGYLDKATEAPGILALAREYSQRYEAMVAQFNRRVSL